MAGIRITRIPPHPPSGEAASPAKCPEAHKFAPDSRNQIPNMTLNYMDEFLIAEQAD